MSRIYHLPASADAFGGHPVAIIEHAWRSVGAASRRWAAEAGETAGMLASTYNRATTQALRLALVLAILEHMLSGKAGFPPSVGEACVRAAIRLLDEHYLPSAERALDAALTRPDPDAELRAIAMFIARSITGTEFNARELRQARRAPCYRDHAASTKALDRLVRLGCVAEAPRRNVTGRGRADYRAHPIFLAAARRAAQAVSIKAPTGAHADAHRVLSVLRVLRATTSAVRRRPRVSRLARRRPGLDRSAAPCAWAGPRRGGW